VSKVKTRTLAPLVLAYSALVHQAFADETQLIETPVIAMASLAPEVKSEQEPPIEKKELPATAYDIHLEDFSKGPTYVGGVQSQPSAMDYFVQNLGERCADIPKEQKPWDDEQTVRERDERLGKRAVSQALRSAIKYALGLEKPQGTAKAESRKQSFSVPVEDGLEFKVTPAITQDSAKLTVSANAVVAGQKITLKVSAAYRGDEIISKAEGSIDLPVGHVEVEYGSDGETRGRLMLIDTKF